MAFISTTFTAGEQPTAAKWNQLQGNDDHLKGKIDQFLGAIGTEPTAATVGTTTSTTYVTSLTTTGALPSVTATVPASGQVLVILQGVIANSTAEARSNLTYSLSGANTLTALANSDTDNRYITNRETSSNGSTVNGVWLHTGLTAGSTTFQVNARVQLGTGQFSAIHIIVIPLGS